MAFFIVIEVSPPNPVEWVRIRTSYNGKDTYLPVEFEQGDYRTGTSKLLTVTDNVVGISLTQNAYHKLSTISSFEVKQKTKFNKAATHNILSSIGKVERTHFKHGLQIYFDSANNSPIASNRLSFAGCIAREDVLKYVDMLGMSEDLNYSLTKRNNINLTTLVDRIKKGKYFLSFKQTFKSTVFAPKLNELFELAGMRERV